MNSDKWAASCQTWIYRRDWAVPKWMPEIPGSLWKLGASLWLPDRQWNRTVCLQKFPLSKSYYHWGHLGLFPFTPSVRHKLATWKDTSSASSQPLSHWILHFQLWPFPERKTMPASSWDVTMKVLKSWKLSSQRYELKAHLCCLTMILPTLLSVVSGNTNRHPVIH